MIRSHKKTEFNDQVQLSGLDPAISSRCRVLIVGSFPSSISLKKREYYANPRNDFWKIIERILEIPHDLKYEERIAQLNAKGVGLWDVVYRCIRSGSADADIRNPEPSPIKIFLIRNPEITGIFCNGRKAESGLSAALQINQDLIMPGPVFIRYLPSTSPAHAVRFEDKCNSWLEIAEYLKFSYPDK